MPGVSIVLAPNVKIVIKDIIWLMELVSVAKKNVKLVMKPHNVLNALFNISK